MFVRPESQEKSNKGYTLAQKMVGRACGVEGIRPGTYCEPRLSTVGSQDTTGPMTVSYTHLTLPTILLV